MSNKWCWRRPRVQVGVRLRGGRVWWLRLLVGVLLATPGCVVADVAPAWVHAQVSVPLPAHDDDTGAVLLYAETVLTVQPGGKMVRLDRRVYKILRPDGERYGVVAVNFNAQVRVLSMRGWCIPTSGKDYGVGDRDAVESGLLGLENGLLASDLRTKVLRIPAVTPGSIVGYEVERELWPYQIADDWAFQEAVPVREARYTLSLPPGWSYFTVWLNHAEEPASAGTSNRWQWVVHDVGALRVEPYMPPWSGLVAQLVIVPLAPKGQGPSLGSWRSVGQWYVELTRGRTDPSPELRQKVVELTASKATMLEKMQALAAFVQNDIRYVGVELGIGGYQPHAAAVVLSNRYGDCKDKVTLLSAMLREIGVQSYSVLINSERGSVTDKTPPNLGFNHVVLAIQLPSGMASPALAAQVSTSDWGNLLFFDPTDELTPFGSLRGPLQGNYGLLVLPDGGVLTALPQLSSQSNGTHRTAKLTLDEQGTLRGEVHEVSFGDQAAHQRYLMRNAASNTDQIKPVEAMIANSFTTIQILTAGVRHLHDQDQPFEWQYTLEAENYAKVAGDLLLVRPRVLGSDAEGFLETQRPREHAIEFSGPEQDTDVFEISLPTGYQADALPQPIDTDYGFASYHSKFELTGQTLRYTRALEIKDLSVPASRAQELRLFYRTIYNDERAIAVLKRVAQPSQHGSELPSQ